MTKHLDATAADLDLFALMVSRLLRQRDCRRAPVRYDYSVVADGRYGEGRPDVHVLVDLGRGSRVLVEDGWISDGWDDLERLVGIAGEFADTIEATMEAADEYRAAVREVRAAARSEVTKANRRDVPWRVVSVEPSPVLASSNQGPAAMLTMEIVGRTPLPETISFDASCASDVAATLASIRAEQESRAWNWERHALAGATGSIDAVLHADLNAAGEDVPAFLRRMAGSEDWVVDLDRPEGGRRTVYWKDGVVHGHAELGGGMRWNEGTLHFDVAPDWFARKVAGRRLTSLVPNPVLEGAVVERVWGKPGERGYARCAAPTLLFDGATGRAWRNEPQALAA